MLKFFKFAFSEQVLVRLYERFSLDFISENTIVYGMLIEGKMMMSRAKKRIHIVHKVVLVIC